jgi:hypothetical protein
MFSSFVLLISWMMAVIFILNMLSGERSILKEKLNVRSVVYVIECLTECFIVYPTVYNWIERRGGGR